MIPLPTPDLSQHSSNLQINTQYRLQAKIIAYVTIGNATFSCLSPSEIHVSGSDSVFGHNGTVDLNVTFTGDNTGTLTFNEGTYPCTFSSEAGTLTVYFPEGASQTNVQIQWWHDGIWVGGPGTPDNLWIGP